MREKEESMLTPRFLAWTTYFANKGPSSQGYGFSNSRVWMWELDCEESWALKNWCFWTVVLEKTLESPLDCKEIQPAKPKGNQSWIFIRRTYAEAKAPILWPPDAKNWLIWTDPDAGKEWRREEKAMTEDEMVGWHHRFDGHEFEHSPGVGDGQGSLECCSPRGCEESDTTEQLNWWRMIVGWLMRSVLTIGPGKVLQKWIPNKTDFQKTNFKGQFSSHASRKEKREKTTQMAPGQDEEMSWDSI